MTQVNSHALFNFIKTTIGSEKLSNAKANQLGIDKDEFDEGDTSDNNFLEIDEILDNKDLYEQFATLFVEEQDKKADEKDAEKEKEEANKVKDKSGAGAA